MRKEAFDQFIDDYGKSGVTFEPCYGNHAATPANLVLEGGSMRVLFSAGVTDFLLEKDIFCENVIGVSGGAMTGWAYTSGLLGWTAYLNIKYAPDPRYLSLESWRKTGNAFNRKVMFDQIINTVEDFSFEDYDNSPMRLTAVTSNIETGEADYHLITDLRRELEYIIASSSMPLVSEIVELDGKKLLDGGACDSIPIMYSFLSGAEKSIVVCTRERGYVRKPNPLVPLMARKYHDYPYFVDRLRNRHYDYNRTTRMLARLHDEGYCYVIWPDGPVDVASMEQSQQKLFDLYLDGVRVAAENYEGLMRYLEAPARPFPPEML